jgi:hypothetical protein
MQGCSAIDDDDDLLGFFTSCVLAGMKNIIIVVTAVKTSKLVFDISCFYETEPKSEDDSPLFWVVEPCSLIEVYRRFSGASVRQHHSVD